MDSQPRAHAHLPEEFAYRSEVTMKDHSVISDEPEKHGGTDDGADPVTLALGALAACTSMTIKMYVQRKGWECGDIDTDVYYDVSLVKDPDSLSEEEKQYVIRKKLRRIRKVIHIKGELDQKKLDRIKTISDRCPVNLMLTGSCLIENAIQQHAPDS